MVDVIQLLNRSSCGLRPDLNNQNESHTNKIPFLESRIVGVGVVAVAFLFYVVKSELAALLIEIPVDTRIIEMILAGELASVVAIIHHN